jgi:hypothetical protein
MLKKGFLILLLFLLIFSLNFKNFSTVEQPSVEPIKTPKIEQYISSYQTYEEIITRFKRYEKESPELIEIFQYGKSSKGKDLYCIKISNKRKPGANRILVTASIHGNEPLSTSVSMSYILYFLNNYNKDKELTRILNETTIYYVPVVSPDSYPYSRNVDNVDPNRDFPTLKNPDKKSILVIENLKKLFSSIKPHSVLSCHTYGRMFLIPYGDSKKDCINHEIYYNLTKKMGDATGYKVLKISQLYGNPIFGTESDWYYRNGALSIVMELGTHQKKPSYEDTKEEFNRTISGFLIFINESPKLLKNENNF